MKVVGVGLVFRLHEAQSLVAVCLLNIYGMATGYAVGAAFGIERRRRRTLSIEIGMQNAGLGTTLALLHLGDEAALPAAIFVFVCIITAASMAGLWQRLARADGQNAPPRA